MTGVDSSAGMLAIAADRLGKAADLHLADLTDPLPFADATFDVVLASLVMHYLRDWEPTLSEFRRVLIPGGLLVFSTHHPFMDHRLSGADNYFATYDFTDQWRKGDQLIQMQFWHRPLRAMTQSICRAGFSLTAVDEPQPDPAVKQLDPNAWESLTTEPRFIFFSAHASGRN